MLKMKSCAQKWKSCAQEMQIQHSRNENCVLKYRHSVLKKNGKFPSAMESQLFHTKSGNSAQYSGAALKSTFHTKFRNDHGIAESWRITYCMQAS